MDDRGWPSAALLLTPRERGGGGMIMWCSGGGLRWEEEGDASTRTGPPDKIPTTHLITVMSCLHSPMYSGSVECYTDLCKPLK